MSEQESPPTSNALPRYRVRRRHGSLDLRTSGPSLGPRFGVRVLSQPNANTSSEQPVAPFGAGKSSSNGWNSEISMKKQQYGASCSPKSGEKTVAQLRQRFELGAARVGGAVGVAGEQHRGHRRSETIRSSLVPIVRQEDEHQTSVEELTAQRAYTLPPFSFSPPSEQPARSMFSAAVLEQDKQGETLSVLQPTVYTGHYEFQTQSANAPMHNSSPYTLSENTTVGQVGAIDGLSLSRNITAGQVGSIDGLAGSIDGLAEAVHCLAGSGDGVDIIDFARVQAIDPSSSARSQKRVRFASKSDHAPSVHYESSSDDSTRSSTTELIDLGEYHGPPLIARRCKSRLGMYDDASESENEELLLLPSLVYGPQPVCPYGTVEDFDDVQEAESPETAVDNVDEKRDRSSAVEKEDSEDRASMCHERKEDLTLLPASAYTQPGHVACPSGGGVTNSDAEANTSGQHIGEEDAFTVPAASPSLSLNHNDVLPGLCEAGNEIAESVVEPRTSSEAVPSSDEQADRMKAKPRRKRRKFIRRLLRVTAFSEDGDKADQDSSGPHPNTLRCRIGRRLDKSVLLLIMWKRW